MNVMPQSDCLEVNPITGKNFAVFFNCLPAGRSSDIMKAQTYKLSIKLVGARCFIFGRGPLGISCCIPFAPAFQCCSCCWVLILFHLSAESIYMFAVSMHWWFKSPLRGPNNLYVYEPLQNLGPVLWIRKTRLSLLPAPPPHPQVIYYWPFQGSASVVVYSSCHCSSLLSLALNLC